MLSTLRCGCLRSTSIFGATPSKLPSGDRNPNGILRKFLNQVPSTRPADFDQAEESVFDWLYSTFGRLHPYHYNDIVEGLKVNTSPGLYYRKLGFKTKRDVLEQRPNAIRYQVHRLKSTKFGFRPKSFVCVVDSTETENGIKNRVAWVYPLVICAAEAMFFEGFRRVIVATPDWVPAPSTMHNQYCGRTSKSYDFKNFDSSVPRWLIEIAFDMIKAILDFDRYAPDDTGRIGVPYSGTSLEQLFDRIVEYFVQTPFVSSTGYEGVSVGGIPSGSTFTNLVDTIVSRLILTYMHGPRCSIKTYGDDCHVKCRCHVLPTVEYGTAQGLGFKLKIEEPNEHQCLTYCKAECHLGQPFHPGNWFAGIFMCAREEIVGNIAYCLALSVYPTREQATELLDIVLTDGLYVPHSSEEKKLAKIVSGGQTSNLEAALKGKTVQCSSL